MIARLGAYPDQVYYDPGRPWWLPFYLDTPTESARKFSVVATGNTNGSSGSDTPQPQQEEADKTPFYVGAFVAALFGAALLIRSLK